MRPLASSETLPVCADPIFRTKVFPGNNWTEPVVCPSLHGDSRLVPFTLETQVGWKWTPSVTVTPSVTHTEEHPVLHYPRGKSEVAWCAFLEELLIQQWKWDWETALSRGRSLTHWMCRWGLMCSCHGPWQEPSRADPNAFQIKHSSNEPISHTVEHHWMSLLIHNQNLFIHPSLRMQPGRLNQQSLGWKISDYKIIWPHHKLAPHHCHWDCSFYNSRNHNDSKNKWAISNLDVDIEIYNG